MRIAKLAISMTLLSSLSCEPDAVTRPRLKPPAVAKFMDAIEMGDPDCNVVSTQCAYRINGVLVEAGTNWRSPPLILWFYFPPWNPPTYYSSMPYPETEDYSGYFGATVGTSDLYMAEGGQVVESSCDPRKTGCLLPLQPRDSAFLLRVSQFYKSDDEMESQEMIDECHAMENALGQQIQQTFNRPAGDSTHGIFRGSNDPALAGDLSRVHAAATMGSEFHVDARQWDGIHQADSLQNQPYLVAILLHEAAHILGKNHPDGDNVDYSQYDYFKYVIVGARRSCVLNYPY